MPGTTHRRSARLLSWTVPPAIAWIAANVISWLAAHQSHVEYWTTASRKHWDSGHYLSISKTGYDLFRCGDVWPSRADSWCGNVAWFPGYPMVMRAVHVTGLPYELAAVLISELALLAMLGVLWWLLGGKLSWATGLTMAIATVFPAGIYFHAAFPMSLAALGLLVAVAGTKRSSWVLAAAGGFVATTSHPAGQVVLGMLALSVLFAWRSDRWTVRAAKAAGATGIAASGLLLTRWMMWRATGHWDAYEIENRSIWHQGDLRNPFDAFDKAAHYDFVPLYHPKLYPTWLVEHSVSAHLPQLWFNLALVVIVSAATGWRWLRDRVLPPEDWAALLLMGACFVTPFLGGTQSWYRTHSLMFVALILVKNLPRWLQAVLLVAFGVQYVFLASMFFSNVLV